MSSAPHLHLSRFLRRRIGLLLLGNLLLLVIIWALIKQGGSFESVLLRMGPNVAPIMLAGLALTGIVYTGAIDLSVASILAVAATVFGIMVHHQFPPWACFGGCWATAWGLSCLNGALVRMLHLPAIIITLAGLSFYRGVALILADLGIPDFGGNISVQDPAFHLPGKQYAGWILAAALAFAVVWERYAKESRRWLALGNSEEACRLAGLDPGRIQQTAFVVGGAFLGLAALIYTTRLQAIEPSRIALGFELQVIGGVILGGTNIFGGEGSYAGTILGALFLYLLAEALIYAGVNPYFQEVLVGSVILGVIGVDCALHRDRKRMEELG